MHGRGAVPGLLLLGTQLGENAMTSVSLPVDIVTYNPELGRLKDDLDAISSQTGLILIYDNGSNNFKMIQSFLDAYPSATLIDGGKNSGMAVALNVLANEAVKREFTDISQK